VCECGRDGCDTVIASEIACILSRTTDYVQYVAIVCETEYIRFLQHYELTAQMAHV
jgi:hypothetical protein